MTYIETSAQIKELGNYICPDIIYGLGVQTLSFSSKTATMITGNSSPWLNIRMSLCKRIFTDINYITLCIFGPRHLQYNSNNKIWEHLKCLYYNYHFQEFYLF